MLLNEPLFYQPPLNAAAQGLIAMMRALMRDVNRNGFASSYLETNVEYDAYHKLSLANIGVVDPIPQVTDLSGLLRQTVSCVMSNAVGGMEGVLASLSPSDREYMQNKLASI